MDEGTEFQIVDDAIRNEQEPKFIGRQMGLIVYPRTLRDIAVVVILAEDRSIQEKLLYYDLKVQTIAQVAPIQLYAASVLSSLFAHLGQSDFSCNF